jgi:hypothetical protein
LRMCVPRRTEREVSLKVQEESGRVFNLGLDALKESHSLSPVYQSVVVG